MTYRSSFSLCAIILCGMSLIVGSGGSSSGSGGSSGTDYTGNTDPAAIDASNAEDIGTTAGEAAVFAVETGEIDIPFAVGIDSTQDLESISAAVTKAARAAVAGNLNLPTGAQTFTSDELNSELQEPLFCGGSVTVDDSFLSGSESLNGTLRFNNLCMVDGFGGTMTLDGEITFAESVNEISITFNNLVLIDNLGTNTVDGSVVCDTNFLNCEWTTSFVGSDGLTHQISGAVVVDMISNFTIEGGFFHATHGEVWITTFTPLTWGGPCYPFPDTGTIFFESEDGSFGSITFYNSPCGYSGDWTDSEGNSGTFNDDNGT